MATTLLAHHWYHLKLDGEDHIRRFDKDETSRFLWQEISPPTITPIAKDLSHAKVGDTVEWFHSSALIMRFFKVLFVDEDAVILLEVNSGGKPTPGMRVRTVCDKEDFSSYALIS